MAGWFNKTLSLSSVFSTIAGWIELPNGKTVPAHGAILTDPTTGGPVDLTQAVQDALPDKLTLTRSMTENGEVFAVPVDGFASLSLSVTSIPSGCTFRVKVSNDGGISDWQDLRGVTGASGATLLGSTGSSQGLYTFPIAGKGNAVRVTLEGTWTGTFTCFATLHREPSGIVQGGVAVHGAGAHGTIATINPVKVASRARSSLSAVSDGALADIVGTLEGALVMRPYTIPEKEWSYASPSGGITDTADVQMKASPAGSDRLYLTGLIVENAHASAGTEYSVKSGASTIFRGHIGPGQSRELSFANPLRGNAATPLLFAVGTASTIYVNATGFTAP